MSFLKPEVPFPAKVLSVSDLTSHIKSLFERDTLLSSVWVRGEISNLVNASSGHCYFTLKDGKSVIRAALWARNKRRTGVEIKSGDKVMIYGNISLYPPRGEYQINVTDVRPEGTGELYAAFEKLKKKLMSEGLFDISRKISLPLIPRGVGIVTSPTGSVVQDIYRVIRRRFRNMPLYLVPVKVQGETAAEEIVSGIKRLDDDDRVDVIIIGRGGGSIEDLWPFNEEIVARAISESLKPIISAVGHETDTTIADMVADRRAATPSVAGELVVPVKSDLLNLCNKMKTRLDRSIRVMIAVMKERYNKCASCRFLKKPSLLVAERRVRVMNTERELDTAFRHFLAKTRHKLEVLHTKLSGLNPENHLIKGYIMARDEQDNVLNSVKSLTVGQNIKLHFSDGVADVSVIGYHKRR